MKIKIEPVVLAYAVTPAFRGLMQEECEFEPELQNEALSRKKKMYQNLWRNFSFEYVC